MAPHRFPASLQSIATAIVLCALSIVFIGSAFLTGVEKKLDARINYGSMVDIWQITVAISHGFYGAQAGYLGYQEVQEALNKHLAPAGMSVEEHIRRASSKEAIEDALQEAISLDSDIFKPHSKKRSFPTVFIHAEDTGHSDYYQLAFKLFGYHATSMYRLYFFLLLASTVIFAWQFRRATWPMLALTAATFSFYLLFLLNTFVDFSIPSVNSNRFMEALGVIPALHILLMFQKKRMMFSRDDYITLIFQSLLLAFTISIRSSAKWEWIVIVLWCVAIGAWALWRQRVHFRQWRKFLWHNFRHSFGLFVVFITVTTGYEQVRLMLHDPVYFKDCLDRPHHYVWHSAFLGLTLHPAWPEMQPEVTRGAMGDTIPWEVAKHLYVPQKPGKDFVCPNGGVRIRSYERILRGALFSFLAEHPRYAFELYFWYKPYRLFQLVSDSLKLLPSWWYSVIAGLALAGYAKGMYRGGLADRMWLRVMGILLAFWCMSTVPSFFAYPYYSQVVTWLTLIIAPIAVTGLSVSLGAATRVSLGTIYSAMKRK